MSSARKGGAGVFFVVVVVVAPLASAAVGGPRDYLNRPEPWYASAEARRLVDCLLTYQTDLGGWPKNVDTTARPFDGDRATLRPTFDNGATTDELRLLARVHAAQGEARDREAFLRGLDQILKAQYPSGGWPQSDPPGRGYARHITFNDGAMVRLMELLREVGRDPVYRFVDAPRRAACRSAFDRGIACILKCQVVVDGRLTAWCAQHDEVDFRPRPARSFELVSLSGSESVGIVRLLMSLDAPSPEVVRAVDAAVAWFESVKLAGLRLEVRPDPTAPNGRDRVVVADPTARPLWARFYTIGTNQPIYADRDGVARSSLSALSHERRNGYAWLGDWPRTLLEREYPAWKARHP